MEQQHQIRIDEIMRKKREEADMMIAVGNSLRWSLGGRLPIFGRLTSSSLLNDDDDSVSSDSFVTNTDASSPVNRFASIGRDATVAASLVGYGRDEYHANYFEEYSLDGIGWYAPAEYPAPPSFAPNETKEDNDSLQVVQTGTAGIQTTISHYESLAHQDSTPSWRFPLVEEDDVGEDDTPEGIQKLMAIACWNNYQHSSRHQAAALDDRSVQNPLDPTIELPLLKRTWTTTLG